MVGGRVASSFAGDLSSELEVRVAASVADGGEGSLRKQMEHRVKSMRTDEGKRGEEKRGSGVAGVSRTVSFTAAETARCGL